MNREARATLICALLLCGFFWAALLLLKDWTELVFSFPLWFVISCLGGYVLSVVATFILVKKFMVDFPLDDEDDAGAAADTHVTAAGDRDLTAAGNTNVTAAGDTDVTANADTNVTAIGDMNGDTDGADAAGRRFLAAPLPRKESRP